MIGGLIFLIPAVLILAVLRYVMGLAAIDLRFIVAVARPGPVVDVVEIVRQDHRGGRLGNED